MRDHRVKIIGQRATQRPAVKRSNVAYIYKFYSETKWRGVQAQRPSHWTVQSYILKIGEQLISDTTTTRVVTSQNIDGGGGSEEFYRLAGHFY